MYHIHVFIYGFHHASTPMVYMDISQLSSSVFQNYISLLNFMHYVYYDIVIALKNTMTAASITTYSN